MTQEQKELLVKDLCARLPYGVKGNFQNSDDKLLRSITIMHRYLEPNGMVMTGDIKPYLFPISSMTDEQKEEFDRLYTFDALIIEPQWELIDWLNKNHIDYRGLIPMGIALDATGQNIY